MTAGSATLASMPVACTFIGTPSAPLTSTPSSGSIVASAPSGSVAGSRIEATWGSWADVEVPELSVSS